METELPTSYTGSPLGLKYACQAKMQPFPAGPGCVIRIQRATRSLGSISDQATRMRLKERAGKKEAKKTKQSCPSELGLPSLPSAVEKKRFTQSSRVHYRRRI